MAADDTFRSVGPLGCDLLVVERHIEVLIATGAMGKVEASYIAIKGTARGYRNGTTAIATARNPFSL